MINDAVLKEPNQRIVDLLLSIDVTKLDTLYALGEVSFKISKAYTVTEHQGCSIIYAKLIEGIEATITTTCVLN